MARKLLLYSLLTIAIVVALSATIFRVRSPEENLQLLAANPENASYPIGSVIVKLTDGKAEKEIVPGSTTKLKTAIFGEPVYADISNDGKDDAVMFLSQDTGGSGIFYYAIAAVNVGGKYAGLNAVFLGDRIAPQNINVFKGVANVNYAERREREPFTTPPSVGVTKYLIVKNGQLTEISQPK